MQQFVKNQSSSLYNSGWTMTQVKRFSDAQLIKEFEKIRNAFERAQILLIIRSLARPKPALEELATKRTKYSDAAGSTLPADVVVASSTQSGSKRTPADAPVASGGDHASLSGASSEPLIHSPKEASISVDATSSMPADATPSIPAGSTPPIHAVIPLILLFLSWRHLKFPFLVLLLQMYLPLFLLQGREGRLWLRNVLLSL